MSSDVEPVGGGSDGRATGKKITEKLSAAALAESTGKDWLGWFAVLDRWGAAGPPQRRHTEIARHLREEHGVNSWHAQSITVGYEQERGLREVGQSSGGTWEASASKTVDAPAERITEAFVDESVRRRWLPDAEVTIRTHRPGKSLTADWDDGDSRISVHLTANSPTKTTVGLGHHKLDDADAVAAYKEFWRERLTALKELLES